MPDVRLKRKWIGWLVLFAAIALISHFAQPR
jgi:hypothetical protein